MRQAEDGDEDILLFDAVMSTLGGKTVIIKLKDGTALIFQAESRSALREYHSQNSQSGSSVKGVKRSVEL